jgi:hypothetical protein
MPEYIQISNIKLKVKRQILDPVWMRTEYAKKCSYLSLAFFGFCDTKPTCGAGRDKEGM